MTVETRRSRLAILCALATGAAVACKPDLDDRTYLVREARVLAVRVEPAEAKPGEDVTITPLVVDATGEITPSADWAFCNARKPLAELGPVNPVCLMANGADGVFDELAFAPRTAGKVPIASCRQFGPEVPESKAGEPPGRPVDPDPTGGYYQPIRMRIPRASDAGVDVVAVARARITCGIPGPSPTQLAELTARNHPNTNPVIDRIEVSSAAPDAAEAPIAVATGQRVTFRVAWAECPGDSPTCTGAEGYAVYDLATQSVVAHREAIRASWFATAGAFDEDHTGRSGDDLATFSENAFTAPSSPGLVHAWAVLRDDRGGVGWRSVALDVR